MGYEVRPRWVQILAVPPPAWVASGRSLPLSEPRSFIYKIEAAKITVVDYLNCRLCGCYYRNTIPSLVLLSTWVHICGRKSFIHSTNISQQSVCPKHILKLLEEQRLISGLCL